jgi:hypothetical protein
MLQKYVTTDTVWCYRRRCSNGRQGEMIKFQDQVILYLELDVEVLLGQPKVG